MGASVARFGGWGSGSVSGALCWPSLFAKMHAMLIGQLAHVPPVPPAWRAMQLAELGGQAQGAPPCLSRLTKVGRRSGQRAAWLLGSYRGGEELDLDLDVLLQLDRNPDEPCSKLLFVRSPAQLDLSQPEAARRSKDRPRLDKVLQANPNPNPDPSPYDDPNPTGGWTRWATCCSRVTKVSQPCAACVGLG